MKKKIGVIMILVLILSVMLVPAVYADTSSQQHNINDTYSKLIENQKQLIQLYEDSGQITSQQADIMRQHMDLTYNPNVKTTTNSNVKTTTNSSVNTTTNSSQQYGPGYSCWGNYNGSNGSNGYNGWNCYSTGSRRCW